MRTAGFLVFVCLGAVLFGCKNKGDADAASDPAAVKAQQDLIAVQFCAGRQLHCALDFSFIDQSIADESSNPR